MMEKQRSRKHKVDPAKLDIDQLTGEENVSVIQRETSKKISGSKAPPLKHLKEWLSANSGYDVDAKWAHVVRGYVSDFILII